MNRFSRIRHHVDMGDVKKRHLQEVAAKKLEKERLKKETEQIKEKYKKLKSDWREDLKESDWTPVAGSIANSTSQTFTYVAPNLQTGEPNTFTTFGLGGVESLPSSVKVDFGFGETENVNPPTFSQLALAGYAKPIVIKRKDPEDTNKKLDASQEFAKKVEADVMMNARVSADEILADVGDQWTYPEYIDMMNKITIQFSDRAEPLEKIKQEYIKNNKDVPISIIDAIDNIVKAQQAAYNALDNAWERYNKVPDLPDGGDETSLLDNIASKMKVGTAKNVFDLHLNYLKNPTGKVQNINNLISKKDINALSKTITNNATIDQLKFDTGALYGVLQNTVNRNSGLRNSLGNLDQSKIYLNDSGTEVVIDKPYDFGGVLSGDFFGGDPKSALAAPVYAGLNVLQRKMSTKDFFKGTDTMMIRVRIPIKKKKKKKG